MATRRERVILDLEDNLSPGLARAAVASRVLKGELDGLGRDSTRAGTNLDKTATSAKKASPEIDRLSGRLRLLRDTAILLGPALVPLGAGAIPLLTGSLAALGSAAGGIGVSILALKGVGDAVKALDDYRLEPTAENLQAVRIEMEKLGPAGAHFVRYLESIEGELRSLQMVARKGMLPGLEDGIDAALERLPGVRKIVRELAEGMGELATSAGRDFRPGGDWDAFFRYLDTDGKDTLVSFGNAIGDITNGLADMMVAFAPVTRQFTGGFEEMAQSFADWAAGLDESRSFQEFLDYVRENGPRAVDMLGSLVRSFSSIVQAAAPVGAVTLPIITKLLDVIGTLASSPLGTPFIVALGAVTAYTRAVDVATAAQTRFNAAQKTGFATAQTTAALAALVVTLSEYADIANEAEERTRSWEAAFADGTLTVEQLKADMQAMQDDGTITGFSDLLQTAMDPSAWVKTSLPGFLLWKNEVDDSRASAARFAAELEILGAQAKQTGGLADFFASEIGLTADQMRIAAGDAQAFSGALAELNGWLDKRAAIRGYREAIQQLAKGLKDGFNREDREQIDATADSIAQVASQIKDKGLRADFLASARASLVATAENAAPKARREIEKVIAKLDELGLTKPPKPELDVDKSKADRKIREIERAFDIMDAMSAEPTIEADDTEAMRVIRRTRMELNNIPDEHVKIYVERVGSMGGPGRGPTGGGGGGSDVNSGTPRIGRTPRSVVPTSLTFGRGSAGDDKAAMYAGMFAAKDAFLGLYEGADAASQGLKGLKRELAAAEKAVERERRKRDALQAQRDAMSSAISGDLSNDLFAVSEGSGNVWAAGATAGGTMDPLAAAEARRDRARRYIAAIRKLKSMGLDKGALSAIIGEGLEATEFMASQPQAYVSEFASTLAEANQYVAQAANMGANAVVSVAEMNAANAELREANKRLKAIEKAIEKLEQTEKAGHAGTQQATQNAQVGWQSSLRRGHSRAKTRGGA